MRGYAIGSSVLAPVALIGGWTVAASRQPPGYSPVRDSISSLAAARATDRWIMTLALVVLGCCHVVTATGLPEIGKPARMLLGLGGAATLLVAALAQPSSGHVPAATTAFVLLTVWPALARSPARQWRLRTVAALSGSLAWFTIALELHHLVGLSERALAAGQALVPMVLVLLVRRSTGSDQRPSVR